MRDPKVGIDLWILIAESLLDRRQYAGVPALLFIQAFAFQHCMRSNIACVCSCPWPRNESRSCCDAKGFSMPTLYNVADAFEARGWKRLSCKCILIRENDTSGERVFDDASCRIPQSKLCMDFVAPVEYSSIVERH